MEASKHETIVINMTPAEAFTIKQVLSVFINEVKPNEDVYIRLSKKLIQQLDDLGVQ